MTAIERVVGRAGVVGPVGGVSTRHETLVLTSADRCRRSLLLRTNAVAGSASAEPEALRWLPFSTKAGGSAAVTLSPSGTNCERRSPLRPDVNGGLPSSQSQIGPTLDQPDALGCHASSHLRRHLGDQASTATGIRTRVSAMRGRRPSPLDDSGAQSAGSRLAKRPEPVPRCLTTVLAGPQRLGRNRGFSSVPCDIFAAIVSRMWRNW